MKPSIESIIIFLQFQKVCQHPHSRLREWAGDALTTLIKRATFYDHKPPLSEDLVCYIYTVFFSPCILYHYSCSFIENLIAL